MESGQRNISDDGELRTCNAVRPAPCESNKKPLGRSCTSLSHSVGTRLGRALHVSGWLTLVAVLLLTGITVYLAFADATTYRMLLPIEVLGENGTTVCTTAALQFQQAELVHSLWLQINGLRYSNQGSVQLNSSSWMPLNNDNVTIIEPGSSFGGVGGGFATLGMTLVLPRNTVVAGPNTVCFRFNQTDGIASGYRVLAWNFLTVAGEKVLPLEDFTEDSPETWTPPLPDVASILTGRKLWETASLTASSLPDSQRIQAHCADCHTQDGRDLKYFNFSNNSIIARSRFHGLSTVEGEQIASYIRSLPFPNPGRPWNPPYQPGPGLDEQPVSSWAAGAGLRWVMDKDTDALPYLFSHSSTQANKTTSSVSLNAPNIRELVRQITPDIFRPDGNLSPRQVPIALQLPDWSEWLPRIHPKDAWGPAFMQSEFAQLYMAEAHPESKSDARRKPPLRTLLLATQGSDSDLRPVVAAFAQWSRARRAFLKHFVKSSNIWSPTFTDKVYSTQLWQLVKTWEMTQEFGLEGRGRGVSGLTADSRSWFNTVPAETAPSAAHIPDGPAGVGGSALTNEYFTMSWYELQILLNSGNHQHRDRSPVDWVYVIGRFRDLEMQTHQPEPTRLLVAVIKALQSTDPRLGPEDLHQGWRPEQNIDPRIMISPNWAPVFKPLPVEVHRAVTASLLTAWLDKTLQYSIAKYLPLGLPPQSYSPSTYGDISGGNVWEASRQFRGQGVPADLVERLELWGVAYTDRAARIQYEGRSSSGKR